VKKNEAKTARHIVSKLRSNALGVQKGHVILCTGIKFCKGILSPGATTGLLLTHGVGIKKYLHRTGVILGTKLVKIVMNGNRIVDFYEKGLIRQ
jgi:hypothetical protein